MIVYQYHGLLCSSKKEVLNQRTEDFQDAVGKRETPKVEISLPFL